MNKRPPKYLLRFFRWFCHPEYVEDIEGDLLERYEQRPSRWRFVMAVLKLMKPSLLRPIFNFPNFNDTGMYQNMITMAWRNALRQKQFALINLLGLTLGVATCLLIGLYVYDELSYDLFHVNGNRIYRVNQPNIWGDWDELSASTGPNVALALREEVPELEEVTRLLSLGSQVISPDQKETIYEEQQVYAAEENFLRVFTFPFEAGNPVTALEQPYSALLTREMAEKYLGAELASTDYLDQSIAIKQWDGTWKSFRVTGILEDLPDQSHLQFDMLLSLGSFQDQMNRDGWKWIWTAFSTYILVQPDINMADLIDKVQRIPPKWAAPTTERIFNQSFDEFTKGHPWTLDLQPLSEIYQAGHPDTHRFGPTGNPLFVHIFAAIGLLVLVLSAINFMNLATARSTSRAKEVGVRKVLGSGRRLLLHQFILESILFVGVAVIIALAVVFFSLDWFNDLTSKHIHLIDFMWQPWAIGGLLLFVLGLGLFSGLYPAVYLSSFLPIQVLKGSSGNGPAGKALRNGLVVFQFTISIALIICSSFVQRQLNYVSDLNMGFEKENILQVHHIEQYGFETAHIKSRLAQMQEFSVVGKSFGVPPAIWSGDRYKRADGTGDVVQLSNVRLEGDYLDLLGVEFVQGRNFDPSRLADKYKIVVNEAAVRMLGWSGSGDPVVGKKIALASGDEDAFEIIGVVKDFHINSARSEIAPLVIIHHENDQVWDYGAGRSYYSMRLKPGAVQSSQALMELIERVEAALQEVDATVPFVYSFMDEAFERTFQFEYQMSKVMHIFTGMALIIGCLGLFGLATFSAERRVKELGIRKVLGARVDQLWLSFSAEFSRLIWIAVCIACPLSWYLVDRWLDDFAFRTPIDWWVFVLAAVGAGIVALGTITFQSLKVARQNPVEALRDE